MDNICATLIATAFLFSSAYKINILSTMNNISIFGMNELPNDYLYILTESWA